MSEFFTGSICIDTLSQAMKDKQTAFVKGKNNKTYCNIIVWVNDKPDEYGNTMSIQLNGRKDAKELEGKVYLGNCKKQAPTPINNNDANMLASTLSNFEVPQAPAPSATQPNSPSEIADDLPF